MSEADGEQAMLDTRARRAELWGNISMAVLAIALTLVLAFTQRTVMPTVWSWVSPMEVVPPERIPHSYRDILDGYAVHVVKPRKPWVNAYVRLERETSPIAIGYSVYELQILGMPFAAWNDMGHVIYYETEQDFVAALATDDYLDQVKLAGPRPLNDMSVGWWRHYWGWLFVAGFMGMIVMQFRAHARRREAEGYI